MRNAVDFVAPVGTPVLAAAGGMVTLVRDDSYSGGPSPEYWYDSNFIVKAADATNVTRVAEAAILSSNTGSPIYLELKP